jgi:hypothetical protein
MQNGDRFGVNKGRFSVYSVKPIIMCKFIPMKNNVKQLIYFWCTGRGVPPFQYTKNSRFAVAISSLLGPELFFVLLPRHSPLRPHQLIGMRIVY